MNPEAAAKAYHQAFISHQEGRLDEAQGLYQAVIEAYENHFHALHMLGVLVSQKGDLKYARRLIEASLALSNDNPEALGNLGLVFMYMNMHEQALQRCDESISLQPDNLRTHMTRSRALCMLARYEEALDSLEIILRLQPDLAEAHGIRGDCLQKLNRRDESLIAYEKAIELAPAISKVLSNYGHLLFLNGRFRDALDMFGRALEVDPGFDEAFFNIGLVLEKTGEPEAALKSYCRAVELSPDCKPALMRKAVLMQELSRSSLERLAVLDHMISLDPGDASILMARASLLDTLELTDQALLDCDKASTISPSNPKIPALRGEILIKLNRTGEAVANFRVALGLGGDAESLNFVLAALGASEVAAPATAPHKFVSKLFDSYAKSFDRHLQRSLEYKVPELIFELIEKSAPAAGSDVLDLGCGTGLCGVFLKPMARTLTGVDISKKMLEMAGSRQLYDELALGDLTDFLNGREDEFDIIVAADVFIYVGELSDVFVAAKKALRSGGIFAFSSESCEFDAVELRSTRRYAHSMKYIRNLADRNRFDIIAMDSCVLRKESTIDQNGFLTLLRSA